jgi:hypothetical protein
MNGDSPATVSTVVLAACPARLTQSSEGNPTLRACLARERLGNRIPRPLA